MTAAEQRTLVVAAVVVSHGLVLAARRRRPAGAWEFPPTGDTWPINGQLHLRVWLVRPLCLPSPGPDHDRLIWLRPADLRTLAWLPADVPVAARVTELLEKR